MEWGGVGVLVEVILVVGVAFVSRVSDQFGGGWWRYELTWLSLQSQS